MSEPSGQGTPSPDFLPDPRRGPRLRFPKAARLTRATAFARVKKYGRSFPGRLLVLGVLTEAEPIPDTGSRVGFVTSKRVGGAVVRTGQYTTVWKKQADGSWKFVLDVGNQDPASPAK